MKKLVAQLSSLKSNENIELMLVTVSEMKRFRYVYVDYYCFLNNMKNIWGPVAGREAGELSNNVYLKLET